MENINPQNITNPYVEQEEKKDSEPEYNTVIAKKIEHAKNVKNQGPILHEIVRKNPILELSITPEQMSGIEQHEKDLQEGRWDWYRERG